MAQIRARLILSARRIVLDHAPVTDGRCRVCRVAYCWPRAAARRYLRIVDDRRRDRDGD